MAAPISLSLLRALSAVDLILDTVAYVDQLEIVFHPKLPGYLYHKLTRLNGSAPFPRRRSNAQKLPPRMRGGSVWVLMQPTAEVLHCLRRHSYYRYGKKTDHPIFSVSRVDIAIDFVTASRPDAEVVGSFVETCFLLKWHGARRTNSVGATVYSSIDKTTRNVALYPDRPSKTGLGPCAHLELRFFSVGTCRRLGLNKMRHLASGINAMTLLEEQTRLAFMDDAGFGRFVESRARELKKTNKRFAGKSLPEVRRMLERIFAVIIQNESRSPALGSLAGARIQDIYDAFKKIRGRITPIMWDEVTSPPRWVHNKRR
ncbi:hypothetical protein [Mesorhizobium sp.]|uniref:hypothetical protein n=1 Tax=Mesorhizobium sp. TaxID=1871066 RepID=UPI000FE8D450|nr:hypothetical protein [Mesorhizobium sp.]RWK65093.1 MAG: hypothetical protein EOR49_05320 [Mesorhizobium sp.]RWM43249.1 MAG: hypothetical protein EOR76_30440 [Mesorhizobium sp.]RWM56407.1 MAG: hypothetical protein EOR78_11380 [Mesorhizobium sp.]RWM60932.1 MAG: hypothetical protein EOR79_05280 [Mesorhizobium sp.]RWN05308.1 MAG: hypothetical protein EOR85_01085 [Mesorhizobium sp.]